METGKEMGGVHPRDTAANNGKSHITPEPVIINKSIADSQEPTTAIQNECSGIQYETEKSNS
jgi:hypothetical protein